MRPLTHQEWEKHYVDLRPHVLKRFPQIDEALLERQRGDYDGLVELVQDATGMDADRALEAVRTLEAEELGIGPGDDDQPAGDDRARASLDQLSLGSGFTPGDRDMVVERLAQLNRRLRHFPANGAWLELTVKGREENGQKVTLSADLKGFPSFVSTSEDADLRAALADVRDDMIRRIGDAVDKKKAVR